MSIRRFRIGVTEGAELPDGRVVVGTRPVHVYPSVADAEAALGPLDWVDRPRPTFSPLAVASVVLPEILGEPVEFLRLLSWITRVETPFWTPPLVMGLSRIVRPHLTRACPWLPAAVARWPRVEDPAAAVAARERYERWLLAEHPGPWPVEPMTPREFGRAEAALRVAAARPWPDVQPGGPLRAV